VLDPAWQSSHPESVNRTCLLVIAAFLTLRPGTAQTEEDRRRLSEFQDRMRHGEPGRPEDALYIKQFNERQRVEFPKNHPPLESTGMVPLNDLGKVTYQGRQGGLYPEGENVPPPAHRKAGNEIAARIRPLDGEGRESANGKVVMISIGMSNTTIESQAFAALLATQQGIAPKFQFVDCAQGGQVAIVTSRPQSKYWTVAEERLTAAGVTGRQVQVAWLKQANAAPMLGFLDEARRLQGDLAGTIHVMHDRYPNLKIVYLSSRIYGGFANVPLNPEPYAYESGFAVKWLIEDQINGKAELNYDPSKGAVKAPWLAWGPYLWADGNKPRSDGLTWVRADLVGDGTHPAPSARDKIAHMLLDFLRKDPSARPWFAASN
jgi:hypothetical protein